ncbi:hypothetical protein N7G274_006255 [Stereocaulon virgatum]|uniref:Uncharacterized protein n=1 Tax=Stereocaulon virgatum TaxID=373712 RepID=A0ABR4A4F8_9LECA
MHYLLHLPLLTLLTALTHAHPQPSDAPPNPASQPQGTAIGASAGILIDTWPVPSCSGPNSSYLPVYGTQIVSDTQSYKLSRALGLNEQLDFSTYTPDQGAIDGVTGACTRFSETTNPDTNGHALLGGTCYSLLTGQANCFELWNRG